MDKLQIAKIVANDQGSRWDLRQGYVLSVGAGTATITLAGSSKQITGVRYMGAVPTASAACWVMVNGMDLFILGQTS